MDRDRRWERTQRAYDLLVHGRGAHRAESGEGLCARPMSGARPTSSSSRRSSAREARIGPGDSVIAFNFRPDRMRQLTRALAEPGFGDGLTGGAERSPGWTGRGGAAPVARYTTLTEYEQGWPYPVVFAPERPATTLGRCSRGRAPRSCTSPRPRSTRM